MDSNLIIEKIEFIYHLTAEDNIVNIFNRKKIYSTNRLVESSNLSVDEQKNFLTTKRKGHKILNINEQVVSVRDQDPISLKALPKCLENGITVSQFIELLNRRVFFWPTKKRLIQHFTRYQDENPIILKVRTEDIFELNKNIELCRLNSGATRCHPKYGGSPPPRGYNSFVPVNEWDNTVGKIAEITILEECLLPDIFHVSHNVNGPWANVNDYLNDKN